MILVALNFNGGSGGGSDTPSVLKTMVCGDVADAMSRLLLSRGLFSVHPLLKIFNGGKPLEPLEDDKLLPPAEVVIDALFQDRFKEEPKGEGLLVVHLDELWQLKKQMKKEIGGDPVPVDKLEDTQSKVNSLVKDFISVLLEYSFQNQQKKGRYILPVVSHTCPDNDLLENRQRDQTLYSPKGVHLFPFSMEQSIELLRRKREQIFRLRLDENRKRGLSQLEMKEINWKEWENIVALAGGHPSLLLNCFPVLLNPMADAGHTPTSEGSMMTNLLTNTRVQSFKETIDGLGKKEMQRFLTDTLLRAQVRVQKHQAILGVGVGWFQPVRDEWDARTKQYHTVGLVSAPFPIIVTMMGACEDGRFSEIGRALDPTTGSYPPTKAMEYFSALAVLLRYMKSIDLWKTFTTGNAFSIVENEKEDFFTVWPISNQAVTDFGGKLSMKKILGQVKLKEPGKHTTQSLAEVMAMAWNVGARVKARTLTGKVHAYWASSRKAQSKKTLQLLVHAFRVAMTGTVTKKAAEEAIVQKLKEGDAELENVDEVLKSEEVLKDEGETKAGKKRALDVRHYIKYLNTMTPDDNYEFSCVGPQCKKQGDSVLPLSDLLPEGIFAGWT